MTSSTDVPGPLAKTAADAAFVQQIISGHDKNDFTTVERAVPDFSPDVASDVAGLKIGVPDEFFISEMDQAVAEKIKETIAALKARGAKIINVSLPHTKYALPVYYIITPSEVSSNLGRYDGIRYGFSAQKEAENLADIYFKTRGRGFGQEPKRRIMLGTYVLSAGYYDAYYVQAQKVRTIINREFDEVFKKVDVLVTPATPGTAFKIGVKKDPLSMYLEDIFTLSPSLAGLPAISVPCGLVDNLPVGCQIIGRKFAEGMVMKVASKI